MHRPTSPHIRVGYKHKTHVAFNCTHATQARLLDFRHVKPKTLWPLCDSCWLLPTFFRLHVHLVLRSHLTMKPSSTQAHPCQWLPAQKSPELHARKQLANKSTRACTSRADWTGRLPLARRFRREGVPSCWASTCSAGLRSLTHQRQVFFLPGLLSERVLLTMHIHHGCCQSTTVMA